MSAIIITPAPKQHQDRRTSQSSESTPLLSHTQLLRPTKSEPLLRSAPLKQSLSRTRFILLLGGVWSANFVMAFQAMAIPTIAPAVGSWFGHAELSSYLGSMFTLASTAGERDKIYTIRSS